MQSLSMILPFLLACWLICSCNEYGHPTQDDPWIARDKCQQLPYPRCQCNESHVTCINAQMTQTDVFLHVHHYPTVISVTFRGNNFLDLPSHVLGTMEYDQLRYLNLSANYFVNVDPSAFIGMPNLLSLDLSTNEMVFDQDDLDLLVPVPKLEYLYLRKAFPRRMHNSSQVMDTFHGMLRKAQLNKLRFLDLSYNELEQFPAKLACAVPNLQTLLLAGNSFRTFHVDIHCFQRLKTLDLSDNYLARLDQRFVRFCDALPPGTVTLRRNPFVCNDPLDQYLKWLRTAPCVQDRQVIKCQIGGHDGHMISVSDSLLHTTGESASQAGSHGTSLGGISPFSKCLLILVLGAKITAL